MSDRARAILDRHLAPLLPRGTDAASIPGQSALRVDLGITSLDAVNLIMELERELDVEINDDELAGLRVVDDVVRLIDAKLTPETEP